MAKFKTGDKVKLLPGYYNDQSSNPSWGGKFGHQIGHVNFVDNRVVQVIWDTYLHGNIYTDSELELVKGDWDE